jgi:hypothetical protein
MTLLFGLAAFAAFALQTPARPASVFDVPPSRVARLDIVANGTADSGAVAAFRAIRLGATRGFSPGVVDHAGQGFYMAGTSTNSFGAYANHTMYAALREPGSPSGGSGFLYAPTMFGPGADCIEAVTVFRNNVPQIWAWDWCAAMPNPYKVIDVTPKFVNAFVRTMTDGLPEFTVETILAQDGKTWDMALYNYAKKRWFIAYQTSGKRNPNYGLGELGWNFFETYTNVLPGHNSDVCRSFGAGPISADQISISFDRTGKTFTLITPSDSTPLSFSSFHCPKFAFSVPQANWDWQMAYR